MYTWISNTTLYAHWKACNPWFISNSDSTACVCSPWSVLNIDWTGCVPVQVTFDANGWFFSGGETEKVKNTIFVELPPVRYSHTPNIDDEGNSNWNYGDNLEMLDVIKFTGSESLYVDLKYATETSYDYLVVLEWEYSGWEPNMPYHVFEGNSSYTLNTTGFYVDWDTVTFLFYSNGGGAYGGAYYGYYAIVEWIWASSENYRCEYDIIDPTREWYIFEWWYIDTWYTQIFNTSECLSSNTTVYAKWYQPQPNDIILKATATKSGQTLAMNKYFANAYKVYRWDGNSENLISDTTHTYTWAWTYTIILSPAEWVDRWTFQNVTKPLVPINGTTMTWVKIVYMPSLEDWFGESATAPWDDFFGGFNAGWAITSLPEWSFNTENIKSVGSYFFNSFNWGWQLISLPEWSFRLATWLTTVWYDFFSNFNNNWALTNLPAWSFDTSNITTAEGSFFSNLDSFFYSFNYQWQLTSLPSWSFRLASWLTTVWYSFFSNFNSQWAITSLPEWSFNTENIKSVGSDFFSFFNSQWAITSLPEWSFDTSNITTVWGYFFWDFNRSWALTDLPKSFKLNSVAYNKSYAYQNAFNSPNYTLNRNVSEIVSWVTAPSSDRNTFSDNQPWRCGVNANWLVNAATGCNATITFDTNGWDPVSSMVTNGKIALPEATKSWYILKWWYEWWTMVWKAWDLYTWNSSITLNAEWNDNKVIILEATATSANKILRINKYFSNAYTVDWWDGNPVETVSVDKTHTYTWDWTYTIILSLTWWVDRWTFQYVSKPLVPKDGTAVTWVKITYMPSLAEWFGDSPTEPGNYFFSYFNSNWKITSLPEWSFDTSKIMTVGNSFFYGFNYGWQLTSLPEWSFDTSNIISAGTSFINWFNCNWLLVSLPAWSFNISWLTIAKDYFFDHFNDGWSLTTLPEWSFDTSNITTVGERFFFLFNKNWQLTSLPEWSFDISKIITVWEWFFYWFNERWAIASLPTNSFKLSTWLTIVGGGFFQGFNSNWALTSLPEWSFDTSKITTVWNYFFHGFNQNWVLTSLPEWSFDTSKITTVWDSFFSNFNYNWKLTSLPDSFKLSSVAYNKTNGYQNAFNSPNYTINKKVSDLVSWITVPSSDRNTFSDNQPWICGEHPNWLVNPGNACKIIYDANWWIWTTTWWYDTYSTWVAVWSGIKVPTRARYILSGWLDASWNKVEEVIFPDMDGEILYANWEELNCSDWYVVNSTWTWCVLKEYTITYNLWGWYLEDGEWNIYEWNQVVTYTYNTDTNEYDPNLNPESIKKENSQFLGWYTSEWDAFDFWIVPPDNSTAYAKFACNLWCVENTEKTACEKIRVDFDANGWKFNDNSDIYSIIKSKQVIWEKTSVLHTANLDDNGNYTNEFNWQTINGYNTSLNPYTSWWITIYPISSPSIMYFKKENVEKLDVSIKYWWSPYCTPPWYIIVWTWDHRQFDANYNPGNTGLAVLYIADFPNFWENREKSVEIEGNSFTIYQNSWCPSYWFFANISRTQIVDLIYEDNAFENIPEPTREWHSFKWWYLSDGAEFDTWSVSTWEITKVYAKWECAQWYVDKQWQCVKEETRPSWWSSGWWGGWGWWGSSSKTDTGSTSSQTWNQINSNTGDTTLTWTNIKEPETNTGSNIQTWSQVDSNTGSIVSSWTNVNNPDTDTPGDSTAPSQNDKTYSTEFQQAYEFAKWNGITTMPTIQKANMDGKLTRIAMAKMLSQYAMNVLWQKPANVVVPKFNDVTDKQNSDYDDGVTLAYQLWIMWQNMPNNNFRPNDEVTRAEFATALSRMAYGTSDWEYKATSKYYIHHMEKLVKEWIITKDDPNMKELRGYVMIMLMRSAK